jgi:hypothetical protein
MSPIPFYLLSTFGALGAVGKLGAFGIKVKS